jgi:hypothetical protein
MGKVKLTKARRLTLEYLVTHPRSDEHGPNLRRRVGMLRMLGESGLASRNLHGRWSATPAGRAALESSDDQ